MRSECAVLDNSNQSFLQFCIVYKVNCLHCDFAYYGQTNRALATRLSEHRRAVCVCDGNSKIAQHANQFGHYVDFDHATIVDNAVDYHKRLFLEAWHSKRGQNAGNEHIEIPDFYVSLAQCSSSRPEITCTQACSHAHTQI